MYIDSPSPLSQQDWIVLGVIGIFVLISYILRHTLVGAILWWNIRALFMIILAFAFVNYTKREIKEWWNKD